MELYNISNQSVLAAVSPSSCLRAVVGTTCALSVLGSLLIIVSYCCFKSLRTDARLILVHLSVMDLGVATANLVGISVNFYHLYFGGYNAIGLPQIKNVSTAVNVVCYVQAGFAIYCTNSSFMWTLSMAVFLYLRIVHHRSLGAAKYSLWACTLWSYVTPLAIMTWKFVTHRVGYSPFSSAGWCGDKFYDSKTGGNYVIMTLFGYDIWVYLTYVLVPVLYVSVYLHVRQELQHSIKYMSSEKFWAAPHNLDYKLLLIPVMFLLLRMWSCLNAIFYVYLQHPLPPNIHTAFTYVAGIGDSGQGAANAMLFVFFTKRVRHKLLPCCYKESLEPGLTTSLKVGNSSVQNYQSVSEKSRGRYTDSQSTSDSD